MPNVRTNLKTVATTTAAAASDDRLCNNTFDLLRAHTIIHGLMGTCWWNHSVYLLSLWSFHFLFAFFFTLFDFAMCSLPVTQCSIHSHFLCSISFSPTQFAECSHEWLYIFFTLSIFFSLLFYICHKFLIIYKYLTHYAIQNSTQLSTLDAWNNNGIWWTPADGMLKQ